ncbi:hypothetical protein C4D60_Mb05t22150 [Musa balbisiana]|uniref:Rho-GAP domain-containing protein n=1 Tax=Musa balbisiana TaxID=52838 RepID=A0A4S8JY03_MUSBA|nr:hypothetical protein C4D60_Mb05t22150 [Musa balbisiana]
MCSVACGQSGASPASMEIGWPTDVRHLAHVTFDRFDGFLGLPAELEPEVPLRVPSASSTVHIAWFRELPRGVLDSLTPDQVMHCNTEEVCSEIARMLPPTEAALLDWAINLMADVVEHEHYNKMNARNIAMVFAPNMTQMADPLTELIHAVQVMNFLKTLIIKTLREREEASFAAIAFSSYSESPSDKDEAKLSKPSEKYALCTNEKILGIYALDKVAIGKLLFNGEPSLGSSEGSFEPKIEMINELDATRDECKCGFVYGDVESMMDRLSFRKLGNKQSRSNAAGNAQHQHGSSYK